MRSSRPIPRATSFTSAPSSSDTFAISLMNEILVARNALDASLIISALATSVRTIGPPSGSYRAATRSAKASEPVVGAHHHAIGMHEVLDRRSLLQELRVGHVAQPSRRRWIERPVPTGHGALHHDRVLGGVAKLVHHGLHAREVGVARVGGRRVHAAEQQPGAVQHLAHLGGEGQALGVALHHLRQARLVDRHLARDERLHLLGQDVPRHDLVAQLGEGGGGAQPDPAHADDAYRFLLGGQAGRVMVRSRGAQPDRRSGEHQRHSPTAGGSSARSPASGAR